MTEILSACIGLFEIVLGVTMIAVPGEFFSNSKRAFRREINDPILGPRFAAVLERREKLESIPAVAWRIVGGACVLFGALTAFRILAPILGFSFWCLTSSVVMTFVFTQMRNRGERRAASLKPREGSAAVPRWLFALAAVGCITPLPFLTVSALSLSAAIVALVSTVLIVAASMSTGMAAILTGEDAPIELAIEERLRTYRVSVLLLLAITVPFAFFSFTAPLREQPLQFLAHLTSCAMWAVSWWWFGSRVLRAKQIEIAS